MSEMIDRRRRLIRYTLKKERESLGGTNDTKNDGAYTELIAKKNSVVTRFSSV